MFVKALQKLSKIDNGYLATTAEAKIKIIFLTDKIVRIRVSFDGKFKEASYALVTTAWDDDLDGLLKDERRRIDALDPACEDKGDYLIFTTSSVALRMYKDPVSFALYDKNTGELVYSDLKERAFDRDQLGRISHYSLINYEKDHFFGFGEKTGHIDKKGRHMRMCPKDAIGHDPEFGEPLYKHIPFYIRINEDQKRCVGLFYNNSYDAIFDMGNERSGYWDSYCYYQADGGDIDLFLIYGPKMDEVILGYTFLTGTTAMPTKQSLGFTASTMYYAELEKNCDLEIYKVIKKHFDERIYLDNFWLASGYSSGESDNLRYTFNWNKKRFPDPEGFFAKMNAMGINVIPNLKPGVLKHHPYMDYYVKADAFVKAEDGKTDYVGRWWGGAGKFVDFTGKAGRDAWKKLLIENILQKGAKTVWNDNCEYDGIESRDAVCAKEGLGGTMAELKIIQSNMMAYTAKQAIAEVYPHDRPYIINRAGFAGIQRYAQVWGGDNLTDWRTLKFNIATIVGMGLSGVANTGCDIGGFAGPAPEAQLLLRWIQNGIFQPRFTMNSANNDNTVTQPWMYAEFLPQVQKAFDLRYKLLPYLYSLMRQANLKGQPVMRPLFYDFPEDENCYNDKNLTFMFGPSLLVANVVEKDAVCRRIYLPKGHVWYDVNDNFKSYQGGTCVDLKVDFDSIPMFMPDTAILIASDDVKHILKDKIKTLELTVCPANDCGFDYYDDDGFSKDFEKGIFANTRISVKSGSVAEICFDKQGSFKESYDKLKINFVSKNKGALFVKVDDMTLTRFLTVDDFDASEEGWFYDLSSRIVKIKFLKPDRELFKVVVSTDKFDLIGMENEV